MKAIARVVPELEQMSAVVRQGGICLKDLAVASFFLRIKVCGVRSPRKHTTSHALIPQNLGSKRQLFAARKGCSVTLTRLCSVLAAAMTRLLDELLKVLVTGLRSNPATAFDGLPLTHTPRLPSLASHHELHGCRFG